MWSRSLILTIVIVLSFTFSARGGGGWPQPSGDGYFKLSQWWVVANQHFTNTGGIDPNATRATYITSLYGEYGFSDRLTGIAYLPFFARSLVYEQQSATTGDIIEPGDAINNIGDPEVGIKYGLIQNEWIFWSASLMLGVPLGQASGGESGTLQTGDGEFNQIIRFDISKSFRVGNQYPFATIYAGFNNRTNGFSDELRYGVEAGISVANFTGILRLDGIESFQNGVDNFNSIGTSIFANNAEYLSFSPEIAYKFTENWGISANTAMALSGELIFAAPSFSMGIFFQP